MLQKDVNDYASKLNKLEDSYYAGITKLGEDILNDKIIPLCNKHKIAFVSGNGDFYFLDHNNVKYVVDPVFDYDKKLPAKFKKLFDVFNFPVSHTQYLGYFIRSFDGRIKGEPSNFKTR